MSDRGHGTSTSINVPSRRRAPTPAFLYQNVLVGLDAAKGINNGEPFLHAAWIGAVAPKPGDGITHIGAGTGYYSAILSVLASPGGAVNAFEIDEGLGKRRAITFSRSRTYRSPKATRTQLPLPPSDLIYVNAGVVMPPPGWLKALHPEAA